LVSLDLGNEEDGVHGVAAFASELVRKFLIEFEGSFLAHANRNTTRFSALLKRNYRR